GRVPPMVVVMPHGHTGPFRFGMRFSDEFERDFLNDLMPEVERRYRVRSERGSRAIAGLSMGGMQTLNVLMQRPEAFAYAGVFSSGVFGLRGGPGPAPEGPTWEERNRKVLEDAKAREGLKGLWFATGRDDFLVEVSRATVELLRQRGWPVTYKETDGGHTWNNWRDYLVEFASLLFR
ncbi:MAG: alpha/beta hydrolase-fold protein, partial [Limisphaera sp.]|nr:alpha/beta hydrolase-fold protein [Limisphaera sp.]